MVGLDFGEYLLTEMQGIKVYINNITKEVSKYAQNKDNEQVCLMGWQCVILEFTNMLREYALYNEKGQPVLLSPSLDSIYAKINIEKNKRILNNHTKAKRGVNI